MAKKNDLGKGLRALISNIEVKGSKESPVIAPMEDANAIALMIDISQIEANPDQPRKDFDSDLLHDLSESIKVHGLIQPITVRKLSNKNYQLISGERRFRAAQIAGIDSLPAYIRTANDQELAEMALIENIQRSDLNPLEIAFCYERLINEFDLTHEQLAQRVGKSRSIISNFLRLIKLPPTVQQALKEEELSLGHAKIIAGAVDTNIQLALLREITAKGLSVRATETLLSSLTQPKSKKVTKTKQSSDPYIRKIEDKLSDLYGAKVSVDMKKNQGQIKIPFSDIAHLNDILEKMK